MWWPRQHDRNCQNPSLACLLVAARLHYGCGCVPAGPGRAVDTDGTDQKPVRGALKRLDTAVGLQGLGELSGQSVALAGHCPGLSGQHAGAGRSGGLCAVTRARQAGQNHRGIADAAGGPAGPCNRAGADRDLWGGGQLQDALDLHSCRSRPLYLAVHGALGAGGPAFGEYAFP